MSLRKLKYHEQKLLKKVDFLQWKSDQNVRKIRILRRYHIQRKEDYTKYNRMVGAVTKITSRLKQLDAEDPERIATTQQLLERLHAMGLIATRGSLAQCEKITASSFCRSATSQHCTARHCTTQRPGRSYDLHSSPAPAPALFHLAAAIVRRRLPVIMFRLHLAESISESVRLVEQGHIRVGPDVVTDPAFLVTRAMEDFVTWVDSSKRKAKIQAYEGQVDDYELLGN